MDEHSWIDKNEYPFHSRYIQLPAGRMHYIDEGTGRPVVMVHGNPTWSFTYRNIIKSLRGKFRCIAMDHLGFGLSDKPADWDYLPHNHAENFTRLMDSLALDNVTLVVQDWGGPIGMSYALNNPGKIARIVVMNTWMWPADNDPHFIRFSSFMGGFIGRFLIRRFNFFVNVIMKAAYGDKTLFTPEIRRHYRQPLAIPADRKGCWVFPKQIVASTPFLASLWEKRGNLDGKPAMIIWGKKDIAFRKKELSTWQSLFPDAKTHLYADAGHFPQEEKWGECARLIGEFADSGGK